MKWQELIELTDEDLEKLNVRAAGARRKLLKIFEQVKEAKQQLHEGKPTNISSNPTVTNNDAIAVRRVLLLLEVKSELGNASDNGFRYSLGARRQQL